MNDAGKEMMLAALKELLDDPAQFRKQYKQPMGEMWKHVLWQFADAVKATDEKERENELHVFMDEHGIKQFADLVRFCRQEIIGSIHEIEDSFAQLDAEGERLKRENEHLRSTLRAVEETLNLTVQRVSSLEMQSLHAN